MTENVYLSQHDIQAPVDRRGALRRRAPRFLALAAVAYMIAACTRDSQASFRSLDGSIETDSQPQSTNIPESFLNSRLVYGPQVKDFDILGFIQEHPELSKIDNPKKHIHEADIYSVDPRLVIALESFFLSKLETSEINSRAVSNISIPPELNEGYYGFKIRGTKELTFSDGSSDNDSSQTAAEHAVKRILAMVSTPDRISSLMQEFITLYYSYFPVVDSAESIDPLADIPEQRPLLLPWEGGETWYYTGGPHGAWGVQSAWGALDFASPSPVGCGVDPKWALASAPGLVIRSNEGRVDVDTDMDGNPGTGLVLLYLHMATQDRTPVGTYVKTGDHIGHPSCEGGHATGAHIHFARKYNGEWLPADSQDPKIRANLSGWTFEGGNREYDGSAHSQDQKTRNAVTSGRGGRADIVSDNTPENREKNDSIWQVVAVKQVDSQNSLVQTDQVQSTDTDIQDRETQHTKFTPDTGVTVGEYWWFQFKLSLQRRMQHKSTK